MALHLLPQDIVASDRGSLARAIRMEYDMHRSPSAQVTELTTLGAKGVRWCIRPHDLAGTMWTLATECPSHVLLPHGICSRHSQYDKQARMRQAEV